MNLLRVAPAQLSSAQTSSAAAGPSDDWPVDHISINIAATLQLYNRTRAAND